jgi:23S rRNA (guanosine2251-2'-O)-methyltransferase
LKTTDFVFGIQSVLETLKSGKEIDKVLVQRELGKSSKIGEIITLAEDMNIPVVRVPTEKLDRITRKNHQGVIAHVGLVNYANLANIIQHTFEQGETPFILLLDRITDVRNFGAICRSAECAGVHAVVIPQKGAAQVNSEALKTSSGALNFLPVCREMSLFNTVKYLQNSGLQVVICSEKAEKTIYEIDFTTPTVVVMGSEEDGIAPELMRQADILAKIPQAGQIQSLNVSVATGVILFEAVRQRQTP